MEQLKIKTKFADDQGKIMILECGGFLDQSNSHELQKMFNNILDSNVYKVIVDFAGLHYMSSAGWGIFVGEIKRFRDHGGDIKLASMTPDIYDVFQMLEFYHILEDYNTIEEALDSFTDDSPILDLVKDADHKESDDGDHDPSEEDAPNVGEIFVPGYKRRNQEAGDREQETGSRKQEAGDGEQEAGSRRQEAGDRKQGVELDTAEEKRMHIEYQVPPREVGTEGLRPNIGKSVKLADLPLSDKISQVIFENPQLSVFAIRRVLRHEYFGNVRIGRYKLYRVLKEMDLHTKEKRYRYFRSR